MRFFHIAVIAVSALPFASAAFAKGEPKHESKKIDRAAMAQQHADDFVSRKVACVEKYGLVAGQTYRIDAKDPTMVQIRDNVWLPKNASKYNQRALEKCADMSR